MNAIVCANDENGTYAENCYSKEGLGNLGLVNHSDIVTDEELKSGVVAWWLNEEKLGVWGQNIGIDTYPNFSDAPVYQFPDGTFSSICDHSLSSNCPTCTKSVLCSICGAELLATGHSFTNYISNHDATCTQNGTKIAQCDDCDAIDTMDDEGTILPHEYKDGWSINRISHWRECQNCDIKNDEAKHIFKWVIDQQATHVDKGLKHEECEICGYKKESIEIPVLGSNHAGVETGDQTNRGLYISLFAMSALSMAILVVGKKKKMFI